MEELQNICVINDPVFFKGLYGALFIKLNLLWTRFRKKKLVKFPLPIVEVNLTLGETYYYIIL